MDKLKTYNTPNGIISQLNTFKGLKVLIGDYASFSYCFTKTVLDSLGVDYVIEHTMYGVKQRILNGEKYDIIFTNNVYESGSGKMLLDKLKEIPNFNTPVVIHTISDNIDNKFIDMGFDGYLKKPIRQDDTIDLLNKLLNK